MEEPIVVIGGGGAGMIAAWRAVALGARVILLERNRKLGVKLLISGGGKCNVTHAGSPDELLAAFRPRERHFLKPCFHRFTSNDVTRLLAEHQVGTFSRDNGRVFPESGRAGDVVRALEEMVRDAGTEVRLNSRVDTVRSAGPSGFRVEGSGMALETAQLVIATGGLSYSRTGTTGDGYAWSHDLGHTVVQPRPALAPIGVDPPLPADWRGIALRGGRLSVMTDGKAVASWDGDILFSHEGISGPAALELSLDAAIARERGPVHLQFDFFPGKDFADLDAELTGIVLRNRGKMISSVLEAMLPNRIIDSLVRSVGVNPAARGHTITREERRAVTALLKAWRIGSVGTISLDRGEVTAGGVTLSEVDPRSMRSRRMPGLYLCGEVLDVAGPVGGYNLQAAFSTGYVAGDTAARDWLSHS